MQEAGSSVLIVRNSALSPGTLAVPDEKCPYDGFPPAKNIVNAVEKKETLFSTGGPNVRWSAKRPCVSYEVKHRKPLIRLAALKRILWILSSCTDYISQYPIQISRKPKKEHYAT